MERKLITLSSDFGKQTQGIGNMEGAIYGINPDAKVIHLMHGIPSFDLFSAARTMETIYYMPVGFHVCVVDPGVGTRRKGVIIKTGRGDYLIGPDNGCLRTAPRLLGGIKKAVEISNKKYMMAPISPIFHGRHVFAPAAAHLSLGVPMEEFGDEIASEKLTKAPYEEARERKGGIDAIVIHVNHFGSLHLNILQDEWDHLGVRLGDKVELGLAGERVVLPFVETFGDVPRGEPLVMKDDYQRMEVSINMGSFAELHPVRVGDSVVVRKA